MKSSPKSDEKVLEADELDEEQLEDVAGGVGHELAHTVQQKSSTQDGADSEYVVQRNESDLAFIRR